MAAGVRKRVGARERDPAVWSRAWRQVRRQSRRRQRLAQVMQSAGVHACMHSLHLSSQLR